MLGRMGGDGQTKIHGRHGFPRHRDFQPCTTGTTGVADPDSLSARVLKAVYFPSNLFLEADLGPYPSRVWRAIVDGKEVLKQGLIRRIGTGEDTEVWHSN